MSYKCKAGQLPSWPFSQVILWRPSNGASSCRRWVCRCCLVTEVSSFMAPIFLRIEFVPVSITNDLAFQNALKWTPKLHRCKERRQTIVLCLISSCCSPFSMLSTHSHFSWSYRISFPRSVCAYIIASGQKPSSSFHNIKVCCTHCIASRE